MVFKTLHLARQSLSKTLTHGYAQSVVAASQSSYASQNNSFGAFAPNASRFVKLGPTHFQNAFQTVAAQSSSGIKSAASDNADSGLAAYYAAWQKHQRADDKEWHQFQFVKRIGWKSSTPLPETKAETEEVAVSRDVVEAVAPQQSTNQQHSTLVVDSFKESLGLESGAGEEETVIAGDVKATENDTVAPNEHSEHAVTISRPVSSGSTPGSPQSLDISELTPATSVSEAATYADQLQTLADNRRYAEIPALFESMLFNGIKPTAPSYNALLAAAVNLTSAKHQVVPKALDVYADMLRRRVAPDSATYGMLIQLLAGRAVQVFEMKEVLEKNRTRFASMDGAAGFMLHSNEAEYRILAEDDSVNLAIKLALTSTSSTIPLTLGDKTYHMLIAACAKWGRVEDMVNVYARMENANVLPSADIFPPMIQALGASGDLRSVVECYDEYKALAIANDKGQNSILRNDGEVYAALVRAYGVCGRLEGGLSFMKKVEAATSDSAQLQTLQETVGIKALLPEWFRTGQFDVALDFSTAKLPPTARHAALAAICVEAADANNADAATTAFNALSEIADSAEPAAAMLAMHLRNGNVDSAETFWRLLENARVNSTLIEPTVMHTVALIGNGNAELALKQSRQMFSRIRESVGAVGQTKTEVIEQIDEAIEVVGQFMGKRGIFPPPRASMELMWSMIENGGIVTPVAAQLLAGLGPDSIAQLGWADITLLLQVQAGMIVNATTPDIAHSARFAHLLDVVAGSRMSVNEQVSGLIEGALAKLGRSDLTRRWQQYRYPPIETVFPSPAPFSSHAMTPTSVPYEEEFDPYAANTDNKGSVAITDLLDRAHGRSSSHLNDALTRFKNMRRAGRHPRFYTYAKLILAAAKDNRLNLAHDILALAKQDVPLLPQFRIVRHGWVTILDAMVAACLTTGQRSLAAQYHRDLSDMGAAPSANTFGLYITTLKESTKTFDEATEAVKIFLRAKAEGVEPSSFLYNALIGKLGKARRIDDCLFYFAEMRNLGIRPTSVTYGTIVNALCRVSDEKFAEELFEEMESMPNYKPRPAPYHSLMQYFLTTKRDRTKVLSYYDRMMSRNIQPTMHTYKLLIDTHATLEPVDMRAAEAVLDQLRASGGVPEAVHYASLIHAKGCVLHDMEGAQRLFDSVTGDSRVHPQACLYQALFEAMVANHRIEDTETVVQSMKSRGVAMTPYIANSLIHGWAMAKNIDKAKNIFEQVAPSQREPSTYEAMTRAFMAAEDRTSAMAVVNEALSRGYPSAVANKVLELVGGGRSSSLAADVAI